MSLSKSFVGTCMYRRVSYVKIFTLRTHLPKHVEYQTIYHWLRDITDTVKFVGGITYSHWGRRNTQENKESYGTVSFWD